MPFNPFSAIAARIYGAAAIAAIVVAGAQTLRIEGALCRDAAAGVTSGPTATLPEARYSRCLVTGFEQRVADRELTIALERAAHQKTKADYREAQEAAALLDQGRVERVEAEQQEISDGVVSDYRLALAAARADAERLRVAGRAGEQPAGAAAGERLPGTGAPPGGAAAAAPRDELPAGDLDWRLVATEQAIQLNALIDWVEGQSSVAINSEAGR